MSCSIILWCSVLFHDFVPAWIELVTVFRLCMRFKENLTLELGTNKNLSHHHEVTNENTCTVAIASTWPPCKSLYNKPLHKNVQWRWVTTTTRMICHYSIY